MKSLTRILLATALVTGAGYTYAKPIVTTKAKVLNDVQDRHLSGFNAIAAQGSFDVIITQGSSESVKVDAPADLMDRVITEVDNHVLKIHNKRHNGSDWNGDWMGHKKITVYVTVRDVNSVDISGSGNVSFKDGLHAESLNLSVSGSGDVIGKVETKDLDCNISGSGNMKLSGHAEHSSVSVSGSGDYSARDVVTSTTAVQVSGSGNASINASSTVTASVSGSGDVRYTGGAHNIVKHKSGSGDISGD
ncbi:head GIN domain-containing protein [Mucilaginibacter sp.]